MLSPQLSAEVRKFCETTSVRGISRIVKSKSTGLFVIWLLAVFTCASLLIWQIVEVFMRYASYPVNTLLLQSPAWQNGTFPDITVCNLCPLVHENELNMTYKEYSLILVKNLTYKAYQEKFKSSDLSEADFNLLVEALWSPTAYLNNFPIASFEKYDKNSPVLDCNYFYWNYNGNTNNTYCSANVEPIFDPIYYKCYTFKTNTDDRKQFRAFSSIFYVDNFQDNQLISYTLDILNPRSTGMRVMLHPPGTVPNMKLGMNVGPGTDTIITLSQTALSRLPDPYSNCTTQETLGSATYTQEYCYDVCYQKQYLNHCGCIFIDYQFTEEQRELSNNTFCGNLGLSNSMNSSVNWNGFIQFNCAESFQLELDLCRVECFLPCQEFKYTTSVSTAPWPHISAQLSFYSTYIYGQPRFGNQYNEYEAVAYLAYTNATVAASLLEKLNSEGLIQKNFLQLTVRFDSSSYNLQQDVAAVPLNALGAQIGGVLSLWLGVTVILLFEFLEFVYNLLYLYIADRRNKSNNSTAVVQSKL